jgi:hypothetical protein
VVVMLTGGFTVTDKDCALLVAPAASLTLTENGNEVCAATIGAVPETAAPFTDNHVGKLLPLQVSGGVPPLAVSDCA